MKQKITLTFIFALTLFFTIKTPSAPAAERIIYLKDGSLLRGEVVAMQNGTYTIQTGNLGTLQLHESKISAISDSSNPQFNEQSQNTTQQNSTSRNANASQSTQELLKRTNQAMKNMPPEAQAMQQVLLSDPQLMQEIQTLASDPQITAALGDPALMNALLSGDLDAVGSNPKAQSLMNNPKLQNFMEKFGDKMSDQ